MSAYSIVASTSIAPASPPNPVPSTTATSARRANRARTTSAARSTCSSVCGASATVTPIGTTELPCTLALLLHQRIEPRGRGMSGLLGLIAPRGGRTRIWGGRRWDLRRGARLGRLDLDELPLDHCAQLRQVRATCADQPLNLVLQSARLGPNALDVALGLRACFAHQQLRLAIGL